MKKIMNWSVLVLMVMALSACSYAAVKDPTRVKCPACGYEFDIPASGH